MRERMLPETTLCHGCSCVFAFQSQSFGFLGGNRQWWTLVTRTCTHSRRRWPGLSVTLTNLRVTLKHVDAAGFRCAPLVVALPYARTTRRLLPEAPHLLHHQRHPFHASGLRESSVDYRDEDITRSPQLHSRLTWHRTAVLLGGHVSPSLVRCFMRRLESGSVVLIRRLSDSSPMVWSLPPNDTAGLT